VSDFKTRHGSALVKLNRAFEAGDESSFCLALRELSPDNTPQAPTDIHRLSSVLLASLTRFRSESRLATLAVNDVPDARLRLDHVLKLTEDAAHRTLDLIEQSVPLAVAMASGAKELSDSLEERSHTQVRPFLACVRTNAEQLRRNLTDVMLAQGFQDLTGQILRSVHTLVGEIESVLQELAATAGVDLDLADCRSRPDTSAQGPAIPCITQYTVDGQSDVDDLLAGLGI
jgi:chemotaxis protein CheZ